MDSLQALLTDIRTASHGITPAGPPQRYARTLPANAITPANLTDCAQAQWADLVSTAAIWFMYDTGPTLLATALTANTLYRVTGPIDLTQLRFFCNPTSSGATVHAWVQKVRGAVV